MKLSDLNINLEEELAAARETMTFGATEFAVRTYLPISEKSDLLSSVIRDSLDQTTGTCSAIRLELYFSLAVVKWYAGIELEWSTPEEATQIYDTLVLSGFLAQLEDTIGSDYDDMVNMVNDTVESLTRYSTSLAGMLSAIGQNTEQIDSELSEIMEKIRSKDGVETLDELRNMVEND